VDGVVCGHIHTAEVRQYSEVTYYNDGDWVEGCTALVEHFDGRMEILHWADEIAARASAGAPSAGRRLMRILIVTDAWTPQVNGVVRTLQAVRKELVGMGHEVA
jgi:hypothetical protein